MSKFWRLNLIAAAYFAETAGEAYDPNRFRYEFRRKKTESCSPRREKECLSCGVTFYSAVLVWWAILSTWGGFAPPLLCVDRLFNQPNSIPACIHPDLLI